MDRSLSDFESAVLSRPYSATSNTIPCCSSAIVFIAGKALLAIVGKHDTVDMFLCQITVPGPHQRVENVVRWLVAVTVLPCFCPVTRPLVLAHLVDNLHTQQSPRSKLFLSAWFFNNVQTIRNIAHLSYASIILLDT